MSETGYEGGRPRGAGAGPGWLIAVGRVEDTLGTVLFAGLVGVVLTQVAVRFLLYEWMHIAWADEIGRALLVWSSFWGAMLMHRENDHIEVRVLYDRLPSTVRWLLRIAADLVIAAFLLLILWHGLPSFLDSFGRRTPASGLPAFIFNGALWTSGALMLLHTAANASRRWRRIEAPARDHHST